MYGKNAFDSLNLNYQATINNRIESQRPIKRNPLVFKRHKYLINRRNPSQFKFAHQAFFIDIFKKARAFMTMNFYGRSNCLLTPFIRPDIIFMHAAN